MLLLDRNAEVVVNLRIHSGRVSGTCISIESASDSGSSIALDLDLPGRSSAALSGQHESGAEYVRTRVIVSYGHMMVIEIAIDATSDKLTDCDY